MLASTHTLLFLATSLLAILPSTSAVAAPAGKKMFFTLHASNNASLCLYELSDLSVTAHGCNDTPENMAWVATAGSAASTTPPLGTITHQYIPTTTSPRNGTFCLAANVTTTNAATVADGTKVVLKSCVSTDVTQKWGIRDGDGTIRLGNLNKCLTLTYGSSIGQYIMQVKTCVAGNTDQKWNLVPKPPSRGLTGYEPGSSNMAFYRETSTSINCLSSLNVGAAVTLAACTFHDGFISASQNFTFVAGSSFVEKGAPGPITSFNGANCFDVVTQTANNVSVDYLGTRPCNGSLTQQWQVNNDSTVSLANTNKCVGQATGTLQKVQIEDCIPGNVNQTWSILRVAAQLTF